MAQIMGGSNARLQAGFAMWTRASTSSPTLHRQLQALRPIRAPLHCRSRAVHPGVSMRTMQARVPVATSPSWRPPPLGQYTFGQCGGARFGQALLSGQRLHRPQAPRRATRARLRIHARHPFEKPGCALQRSSAGRGHPQRRARACQSLALERWSAQPGFSRGWRAWMRSSARAAGPGACGRWSRWPGRSVCPNPAPP